MFEKLHLALVQVWCESTVQLLLQIYTCKFPGADRPAVES